MGHYCRIYLLLELEIRAIEEITISRPTYFRNLLCLQERTLSHILKTLVEDWNTPCVAILAFYLP